MKTLVFCVSILLALGAMFAARVVYRSYMGEREDFQRSPSADISKHPESTGVANLREVSFSGSDGHRIAAWYVPPRNRAAIVLAHGTQADRSALLGEIKILVSAGFGVLALDLPGQGASEGMSRWGEPEQRAIAEAVSWLSQRPEVDPARIGGFGFSMGGFVMAQAAVVDTRLRAVALVAAPSEIELQTRLTNNRWGWLSAWPALMALRSYGASPTDNQPVDIIRLIAPRAVFILGGDQDTSVPAFMTEALYRAAKEPKSLWIIPGARHGDYLTAAPQQYASRLVEFFSEALLDQKN